MTWNWNVSRKLTPSKTMGNNTPSGKFKWLHLTNFRNNFWIASHPIRFLFEKSKPPNKFTMYISVHVDEDDLRKSTTTSLLFGTWKVYHYWSVTVNSTQRCTFIFLFEQGEMRSPRKKTDTPENWRRKPISEVDFFSDNGEVFF